MADFINSQFLINFVRESPPENYKLLQGIKKQIATSYENGERTLQVTDVDIPIIENSTNVYIIADKPITITLSTGITFEGMEEFAYSAEGRKISVSVSNLGHTPVRVLYAAGIVLSKS